MAAKKKAAKKVAKKAVKKVAKKPAKKTKRTPNAAFSPSATRRADWSVAEPGPNGTRIRNGPLGKLSARPTWGRA